MYVHVCNQIEKFEWFNCRHLAPLLIIGGRVGEDGEVDGNGECPSDEKHKRSSHQVDHLEGIIQVLIFVQKKTDLLGDSDSVCAGNVKNCQDNDHGSGTQVEDKAAAPDFDESLRC